MGQRNSGASEIRVDSTKRSRFRYADHVERRENEKSRFDQASREWATVKGLKNAVALTQWLYDGEGEHDLAREMAA